MAKENEADYSRCPSCDTETDRHFKNGGVAERSREEYLDWSLFSCDPRKGGCGTPWSRATKQGYQDRLAKGQPTRGLTRAAAVDAVQSVPSRRFMDRWELIDWSK